MGEAKRRMAAGSDPPQRKRRPGQGSGALENINNSRSITEYGAATQHPLGGAITRKQRRACERASEADRLWFAGHSSRSHRIRPAFDDEVVPVGNKDDYDPVWVVVRQLQPGIRFRVVFTPPPPPLPDIEPIGHALFDLLIEHARSGERAVPTHDVAVRAALMSGGGRA